LPAFDVLGDYSEVLLLIRNIVEFKIMVVIVKMTVSDDGSGNESQLPATMNVARDAVCMYVLS
jgi:hypothetical protein